jgi:hypothetical protein
MAALSGDIRVHRNKPVSTQLETDGKLLYDKTQVERSAET